MDIAARRIKTAWWLEEVVEKKDTYKFRVPVNRPCRPYMEEGVHPRVAVVLLLAVAGRGKMMVVYGS